MSRASVIHRAAGFAALCLLAQPATAEVTLSWDLPTRLEYCVDSGPVLDRLAGTRVYRHHLHGHVGHR